MAGRVADSTVGAVLATIGGLDLAYAPERKGEPEIDYILTVGDHRIPLEVKYQTTLDPVRDVLALRAFIQRDINRAPFGILVTRDDTDQDFGSHIVALPLSTLMLLR